MCTCIDKVNVRKFSSKRNLDILENVPLTKSTKIDVHEH